MTLLLRDLRRQRRMHTNDASTTRRERCEISLDRDAFCCGPVGEGQPFVSLLRLGDAERDGAPLDIGQKLGSGWDRRLARGDGTEVVPIVRLRCHGRSGASLVDIWTALTAKDQRRQEHRRQARAAGPWPATTCLPACLPACLQCSDHDPDRLSSSSSTSS